MSSTGWLHVSQRHSELCSPLLLSPPRTGSPTMRSVFPHGRESSLVGVRGLISQKMFTRSFCKSHSPHKSVNSFFILATIKDKLTDFWRNCLLPEGPSGLRVDDGMPDDSMHFHRVDFLPVDFHTQSELYNPSPLCRSTRRVSQTCVCLSLSLSRARALSLNIYIYI